jgi:hypothetical protein
MSKDNTWKLYLNDRLCNGNNRFKRTEEERKQYTLDELKKIAKDNGIKGVSGLNKTELCVAILDFFEKDKAGIVKEPVAAVPLMIRRNSSLKPLNHLKINETTISSISGPISFYYFRPTNKLSKLPLIMLFGDMHRARDKMCKKCSCSKETKSCCYKISDSDFLQLFDAVGSRFPIDFYTETSFTGTGQGFENGEMEILTTGDMTSCYHHRLRDTEYDKCPTRNIRWHAGDIRAASYDTYYMLTQKLNSYNTTEQYKKTSKYFEYSLYVESQLKLIFVMIQLNQTITEEYFEATVFGSFEGFKSFIMILFGPEDEDEEQFNPYHLKNFARTLFDFGQLSAINKQIQKQSLDELKNREVWVRLYAKSIKKIFNMKIADGAKSEIKIAIQSTTLENIKEEDIKICWKLIGLGITTPLLEMYVLARMFKQPTDGYASSLSIAYFGNAHIVSMVDILRDLDDTLNMTTSKYELVAEIDADYHKVSRCLTMPPIDLNYDLINHTVQRVNIYGYNSHDK